MKKFKSSSDKSDIKMNIDKHVRNTILIPIKVLRRTVKETAVARYFMKVTATASFTGLRTIKRISRV